jgi:putative ABC transport system substrate-binding protein
MRRREFIGLAGAAAAWPLASRAQNTNKAPKRIAFFPDLHQVALEYWQADMRALGWTEGQDFIVLRSGIEAGSRNPSNEDAQRVVANKPDLIFVAATNYALAAQQATGSIPIVMLVSGYPVEAGVADSLAKPGRNVTGNTTYAETGVWGKLLQLLREAKPDIKRVGILWTYVVPAFPKEEIEPGYAELNTAARSLNLELHIVDVANSDQAQAALAEVDDRNPEALLLTSRFNFKARSVVGNLPWTEDCPQSLTLIGRASRSPIPF